VRIDSFLIKHFRNYTSWRMQRLVRAGQVSIEGTTAETADRVFQGQQVRVRLIEPPDNLMPSETRPVEILFEDPWLVVVNKPLDMVVHPCGQYATGSLCNVLQTHLDQQTQLPGLLRAGVVHRLDRLTSGVIVFAKDHLSHRKLSIAFQKGYVTKNYLALVHGREVPPSGTIEAPLGRDPRHPTRFRVDRFGRPARTHYRTLAVWQWAGLSLLEVTLETGRTHQIRVHAASIGHPVAGDPVYGRGGDGMPRLFLHAARIEFEHPINGDRIEVRSPLPDALAGVLTGLGDPGEGSVPEQ